MKYQRLVLRYDDRVSGSTFSNPQFRVNLDIPSDKPVKVYLEGCFLNADQNNTVNENYVRITLKNASAVNSIVSKDGGFIHDGVLGRVGLHLIINSAYNAYNMNSTYNDSMGNLLCFPNQIFKLGILDLDICYGDNASNPIIEASTGGGDADLDNYCIILGIYNDDDEYNM